MEACMYDDEHPLVIALAWTLAGVAFTVFFLAKLGAFNPSAGNIDFNSIQVPQLDSAD